MNNTDILNERRREFARRVEASALVYMRKLYGDEIDFAEPELSRRLARACEGAARELARTGALRDLGIDRPAQVRTLKVEHAIVTEPTGTREAEIAEAWGFPEPRVTSDLRFYFAGTVLEGLCPGDGVTPCGELVPCTHHGDPNRWKVEQ
jgi:hypothetical protein